jgi:tetratricopeptide (TPR) repeat protein
MERTRAPRWLRSGCAGAAALGVWLQIATVTAQALEAGGSASQASDGASRADHSAPLGRPPAEANHPVPARGSCSVPPSAEPRTAAEEARALYQQFECHFARGEYEQCLPYIERACHLTSSPRCLFNLGAVHHALMHCSLARGYYEQFLDRAPYDDGGGDAQSALHELQAACPAHEAALAEVAPQDAARGAIVPLPDAPGGVAASSSPPVLAEAPPITRQPVGQLDGSGRDAAPVDAAGSISRRTLAWSLIGAGAAAGALTILWGGYGVRAESDYVARNRRNGMLGLSDDSELRAIDRRGRQYNQLMLGFGVASGLLLAAGGTLVILDVGDGAQLSLSADGVAGIDLRRSF